MGDKKTVEKTDLKKVLEVLLDFRGKKIKEYCLEKLNKNVDPYEIFNELSAGLEEIGRGYENKEFQRYFTSDLIVSGKNMKTAIEILKPHIKKIETTKVKGKVVLGTIKGDVHDIGKNIFAITLESNGFEVIDLGVDVDKKVFIEKVKETGADILGMSALLTTTVPYMEEVVEELRKESLDGKVRVIIGGRATTEEFAKKIGVIYGKDSIDGLRKCLSLVEGQK
ncbi:cobalamin-binding protein [Candidatus Bathyarchaeota archaeon]|nr:MAG: cobalamin-binding protein [Candidatus Bathyarchaeota archaeon]